MHCLWPGIWSGVLQHKNRWIIRRGLRMAGESRLLLFAIVLAMSGSLSAQQWHAHLADDSNDDVTISLNSGRIEITGPRGTAVSFPATAVTDIFSTSQAFNRSWRAADYFNQRCCPDSQTVGRPETTSVNLLPMLAAAVAAPFGPMKEHYVEVRWFHNEEGSIIVKLPKQGNAAFLDWLQHTSGVRWVDLDRERQSILDEIKERANQALSITVHHKLYRALPIQLHGETQLLFFENEVKAGKLAGTQPVKEEWSDNRCVSSSAVLYQECGREECPIEAVLLPITTYRVLRPAAEIVQTATVPLSDCKKLEEQDRRLHESHTSSGAILRRIDH